MPETQFLSKLYSIRTGDTVRFANRHGGESRDVVEGWRDGERGEKLVILRSATMSLSKIIGRVRPGHDGGEVAFE